MFRNLTLGTKILLGFVVILAILVILALFAIINIGQIVSNADEVIAGNRITGTIIEKKVDHLEWAARLNDFIIDSEVDELTVNTDPEKCGFGEWFYSEARTEAEQVVPQIKDILQKIEEPHKKLHESAIKIEENYVNIDPAWSAFFLEKENDHYVWINNLMTELISEQEVLTVQMDDHLCNFGKFLYGSEIKELKAVDQELAAYLDEIKAPHKALHDSAAEIQAILDSGTDDRHERALDYFNAYTQPKLLEVKQVMNKIVERIDELIASHDKAVEIYNAETKTLLNTVKGHFNDIIDTTRENMMSDEVMIGLANQTRMILIIFSIIAIALGLCIALLIARSITRSLKKVMKGLEESSTQVAQASNELSGASQQLAEGSSEQASSLEETAATLNESSSMLQRTSENTTQASRISETATESSEKGRIEMEDMMTSMQKLNDSSQEISKIIKVIDDIAFQTNILSLNAAVEAARAGEAGAGFAVVAEEVRNLAQRSAKAANDTKVIIEKNIVLSKDGMLVAEKVKTSLSEIGRNSQALNSLIEEINTAAKEQVHGINQINQALNQMEQVTQQNAANAEETASSSEELNAQAEILESLVNELSHMIGGTAGH